MSLLLVILECPEIAHSSKATWLHLVLTVLVSKENASLCHFYSSYIEILAVLSECNNLQCIS